MKKRIVVKVGSAVLTEGNKIAKDRMQNMVGFIASLKKEWDVALVSSGAVAAGYDALKIDKNIETNKRALASAGQPILMHAYKKNFDVYDIHTSQLLLIDDDFDSKKRTHVLRDIVNIHLDHGVLPIINENDVSAQPEQVFGDNDQLSAYIAHATGAEMLIIFTDIDGYYDKNPKKFDNAKLFKEITKIPEEALLEEHTANNPFATGGIVTKLKAAEFMMQKGHKMFLCSGFDLNAAKSFFFEGKHTQGTLFLPKV